MRLPVEVTKLRLAGLRGVCEIVATSIFANRLARKRTNVQACGRSPRTMRPSLDRAPQAVSKANVSY